MGAFLLPVSLVFPLAEIAVLILVGSAIGVLPTLALLVLGVVAGVGLIRLQGFATLLKVRTALARGEAPADALFQGACVVAAGVLLIVPGFLSDLMALALLLFLPFRRLVYAWIWRRVTIRRGAGGDAERGGPGRATVIEGEYRTVDEAGDGAAARRGPSPWRRDDGGSIKPPR